LCGFPGICLTLFGVLGPALMAGGMDSREILPIAAASVCVGLFGLLVPIGVGFFTLRKKPTYKPKFEEPIPPPN
jgi:hypothetical protein